MRDKPLDMMLNLADIARDIRKTKSEKRLAELKKEARENYAYLRQWGFDAKFFNNVAEAASL